MYASAGSSTGVLAGSGASQIRSPSSSSTLVIQRGARTAVPSVANEV